MAHTGTTVPVAEWKFDSKLLPFKDTIESKPVVFAHAGAFGRWLQ